MCGSDEFERRLIIEWNAIKLDLLTIDPLDLAERISHRGLHPDPEHIEFEQAEFLDIVLIELAHRKSAPTCFNRRAIEQGGIGEQHTAGM